MDFGTGGLDLAYEVMRGYHALVLIDVSQQGGEPGTLYVIEPDPAEIEGGIEDGEVINPHGMDPRPCCASSRRSHGWPGKVVVVACEPAEVEEMGDGALAAGRGGGRRGDRRSCSSRSGAADRRGLASDGEAA